MISKLVSKSFRAITKKAPPTFSGNTFLSEVHNLGIVVARTFATSHGGLKDQDRIFTNVYKDGDPFIDGALKRVTLDHLATSNTCV